LSVFRLHHEAIAGGLHDVSVDLIDAVERACLNS
jgi:hypothetical protein